MPKTKKITSKRRTKTQNKSNKNDNNAVMTTKEYLSHLDLHERKHLNIMRKLGLYDENLALGKCFVTKCNDVFNLGKKIKKQCSIKSKTKPTNAELKKELQCLNKKIFTTNLGNKELKCKQKMCGKELEALKEKNMQRFKSILAKTRKTRKSKK